jgi:voltage-gated potassium channel
MAACVLYVAGTYYASRHRLFFAVSESIIVAIFSAEYILRIFVAENNLRYIFSFYGIIDLISILPSFITSDAVTFLRALKVLRILRFLRFLETETFFFGRISRFRLQIIRTVFTVFTILFVSAGLIYSAENLSNAEGITIHTFGEAFYFAVTTLSTVGFGDFVPVSSAGRMFTAVMIMTGAILIPWQLGKLVRMLVQLDSGKTPAVCPQCGLTGHDPDASHCKACGHVIYQEYFQE